MSITTILLVREYRFFVQQIEQLGTLKDDYHNYALILKRMIIENNHKDENSETESEEKKKVNDTMHEEFIVVNRERSYLRESALHFARRHNLEPAVRTLYDVGIVSHKQQPRRLPKLRANRKKNASPWLELIEPTSSAPLKWPIERKQFWLSSPFGPRKKQDGSWGFHHGIDMAAVRNTPVRAAAPGIVIEAGYAKGYGNTIVVAHSKTCKTRYAHLQKILVQPGQKIDAHTIIGKVGDTGLIRKRGRDGSHLHFEVSMAGKKINPLCVLT